MAALTTPSSFALSMYPTNGPRPPVAALSCPLCHFPGRYQTADELYSRVAHVLNPNLCSLECPLCLQPASTLDQLALHLLEHRQQQQEQGRQAIKVEVGDVHDESSDANNVNAHDHSNDKDGPDLHEGMLSSLFAEPSAAETAVSPAPKPTTDELDRLLNDFTEIIDQDISKNAKGCGAEGSSTEKETSVVNQNQTSPSSPHQSGSHQLVVKSEKPSSSNNKTQVQCDLCGWNFDDENFLQLHRVLMHSRKNHGGSLQAPLSRAQRPLDRFHCRFCPQVIPLYDDYVAHLAVAHGERRQVCPICGKMFKLRGSLLVHQRVVHNPNQGGGFYCGVCNRKFNNKYRKNIHEKRHTAGTGGGGKAVGGAEMQRPRCLRCSITFEEKGEFEAHMAQHSVGGGEDGGGASDPGVPQAAAAAASGDANLHKCNVCNLTFDSQAALILHSVCHIEVLRGAPFQPDGFEGLSLVAPPPPPPPPLPLLSPNPVPSQEEKSFACSGCHKTFMKEVHLNQHMKVHNNGNAGAGNKQWECDVCHKTFTTKYFLKKHNRLHTGETPYECNLCGRAFTFQQSYHKHMLYHTDQKPYVCSQCGRAFKELSTLQNHERIHSGERPFECETCGKSFRQRVSYLVHRRIHTGDMPYSCNICGKNFRYKVTQRTHRCQQQQQQPANASSSSNVPALPLQIQQDLHKVRQAKGRKTIRSRLQEYLRGPMEEPDERTASQSSSPSLSPTLALPYASNEATDVQLPDQKPQLSPTSIGHQLQQLQQLKITETCFANDLLGLNTSPR